MTEQMPLSPIEMDSATENAGRRKLVALVGIVAVVAALGVSAYLFLGGGGSAAPSAAPAVTRAPAASGKPTTTPTAVPTIAVAVAEPIRHDPFKPLYTPKPPPVTASATPAPAASGSQTPGATNPSGGPLPFPSGSNGQDIVQLQGISTGKVPSVTVNLDGKQLTGVTGDTLGGILKVVAIRPDDHAATFQLGDVTFDLSIGKSYTN